MDTDRNTDYLNQRLADLGVTDKLNTFTRVWCQDSSEKVDGKIVTASHEQTRD
jgi:hypothetical protein